MGDPLESGPRSAPPPFLARRLEERRGRGGIDPSAGQSRRRSYPFGRYETVAALADALDEGKVFVLFLRARRRFLELGAATLLLALLWVASLTDYFLPAGTIVGLLLVAPLLVDISIFFYYTREHNYLLVGPAGIYQKWKGAQWYVLWREVETLDHFLEVSPRKTIPEATIPGPGGTSRRQITSTTDLGTRVAAALQKRAGSWVVEFRDARRVLIATTNLSAWERREFPGSCPEARLAHVIDHYWQVVRAARDRADKAARDREKIRHFKHRLDKFQRERAGPHEQDPDQTRDPE